MEVLLAVAAEGAYSNLALSRVLNSNASLPAAERALLTELVYGTLRMQGTIDYILGCFVKQGLAKLPLKILLILRLGVYQLLFMERIPPSAAVNESVKLAKRYGHQGTASLTNAVLRNVERQRKICPGRRRQVSRRSIWRRWHLIRFGWCSNGWLVLVLQKRKLCVNLIINLRLTLCALTR